MRFKDKVVIVTGGGQGVGRAASLAFAREGARVVIADFDPFGARDAIADVLDVTDACAWVRADLRLEDDILRVRDRALEAFGRIDVLVNNAALGAPTTPLERITPEEWDAAFDANVRQMFLCSKHVIPVMARGGGGAIVSTSSVQAFVATASIPYGPAKAGIVNLTRHIALYHGPQGIRANCVCPGHIATPRLRELYEREPGLVQLYPVGRLGRVEDLVAAYLYLASPDAGFVNGAVLMLDGGYSAT